MSNELHPLCLIYGHILFAKDLNYFKFRVVSQNRIFLLTQLETSVKKKFTILKSFKRVYPIVRPILRPQH